MIIFSYRRYDFCWHNFLVSFNNCFGWRFINNTDFWVQNTLVMIFFYYQTYNKYIHYSSRFAVHLRPSWTKWKPKNNHYCPIHLSGQNNFCPGQNQNCLGQNIFCPEQKILYKKFFISDELYEKWLFSFGQKFLSGTKNILSGTKVILSRTKNILFRQMDRALVLFTQRKHLK